MKRLCFFILILCCSGVWAYPPDNAAVLYYKAFQLMEFPEEPLKSDMVDYLKGEGDSSDAIEAVLQKNQRMLELIQDATEIENCDWGLNYQDGFDMLLPELGPARRAAYLLLADARRNLQRKDQDKALGQCLAVYRMAYHVGDNILVSYIVNLSLTELANRVMVDLLSEGVWNQVTLIELKNHLADIKANRRTLRASIQAESQMKRFSIKIENKDELIKFLEYPQGDAEMRHTIETIQAGDEAFFAASLQYYLDFSADMKNALDGPVAEVYPALQQLAERPVQECKVNDYAIMTALIAPSLSRCYCLDIRARTHFNALQAAIELFLTKLRTGQLPDQLPAGLPQDLFSNLDFAYEKTGNSFTLRCQAPDPCRDTVYDYQFTVK